MKYLKPIVKPGRYSVNRLNGERGEEVFTAERLQGWVENFRKMRASGLRVPAPFRHDQTAVPGAGDPSANPEDSRNNGGWWEDLFVDANGELNGVIEVPDSHPDREKIGTTIQEVSPLVLSNWKDGAGREWKDSILHIALVTHPVIPGQGNFHPLPATEPLAAAMSFCMSGLLPSQSSANNGPTGSLTTVIQALKALGIELPTDTTAQNLAERLVVACKAIVAYKGGENEGPNGNPQEQPTPIVMANALLSAASLLNSPTAAPTAAPQNTLPSGEPMSADPTVTALSAIIGDQRKADYKARIDALVSSGRLTPAARKQHLDPLVESFQLSLDPATHRPVPSNLDTILAVLEAQPEPVAKLNGSPIVVQRTGKNGRLNGFAASHGQPREEGIDPALLREPTGLAPIDDEDEFDKSVEKQIARAGLKS